MNYKILITGLLTSVFISSACLAAGSNPLYSCKNVKALANKDEKSKSNFVFHTMPNYVGNSDVWRDDIEAKFAWINKYHAQSGRLLIFFVLNKMCNKLPSNYNPTKYPIEDMYFYAVDNTFKYLEKKDSE
ncbi:hypothetical protein [Commensalibacter nepenthis]|uniref:Uncharacterized protein n=1 Tax=Commensalibacter nepenthis TaxID=3043872 RepID=A0ABT6Q591_9PROT|nr:hypothetical protein [Commensalibacter sp. TBRC 10068]MDI2112069.1 hypothetical protein [Commensalibacter sp. TBRC 10068]